MALSDDLEALAKRHGALSYRNRADTQNPAFGFSVAGLESLLAEVRKSDEALIRQLVEALDECKDSTQERIDTLAESGIDKHKPRYFRSYVQDLQRAADAISAGRARLEGKP